MKTIVQDRVSTDRHLRDFETPRLIIDRSKMEQNIARMAARATALGVDLRPHMKTAKCVEVARLAADALAPRITVSTLKEAEFFAQAGFRDILYAVGFAPNKAAFDAAFSKKK